MRWIDNGLNPGEFSKTGGIDQAVACWLRPDWREQEGACVLQRMLSICAIVRRAGIN